MEHYIQDLSPEQAEEISANDFYQPQTFEGLKGGYVDKSPQAGQITHIDDPNEEFQYKFCSFVLIVGMIIVGGAFLMMIYSIY